ncbi:acetyl-CoA acetyltransferase [Algimonas arctica]|uniref:Acetyl-CoA acetyltransferase n=1 Tax=Algimonas arctica TaxID=1479486 RepID=A0A8J3G196_9PROT|nr:acetyl-CoA C-acyltransferase [Algimonas arctica]GHA86304.1 acetyl-CoA acetyltransferase [Algimonas arctica]
MDVYIQDCVRTPRGKGRASGGLADQTPHGLVGHLVDALEARTGLERKAVQALTLGCVGQVGAQGGNVAMTAKIHADLSSDCPAHVVNNFCASGLTAIGLAANTVSLGQNDLVLGGGVEMLSRVPFMADEASYYSDASFSPTKQYIPVALAADLLAQSQGVTRAEMDALSLRSQQRAEAADQHAGLQASRIQIGALDRDEAIRPTDAARMAAMPPAFSDLVKPYARALDGSPINHQMTKSHAPPMTDGSGLALLGTKYSLTNPRARIVAYAEAGGDARESLLAGIAAMVKTLSRAKLQLSDMDRIEFMEAFAPTVAIFERDFEPDLSKVNVGGGHIAKGHPMGATGAILLSTLMDALDVTDGRLGLVVVTGAQGAGAAMIVERLR